MSGSRPKVGTHWRKPPTRVYDYNYNLGEHYYKPQLRHADQKFSGRRGSPPRAKYFAERFAEEPVYGISGPPNWRTAGPRRSSLDDFGFGRRPSGDRFADRFAPDDSDFGRPSRFGQPENDDLGFGRRRAPAGADDSDFGSRPSRFGGFGDRLDVGGAGGRGASPGGRGASPGVRFARGTGGDNFDDAFDEPFFQRGKRFGRDGPLSADPDFITDDPFKALKNRRALAARDEEPSADQLIEDMKREAESSASRFRSKLRAKRAQEELEDSLGGGDDSFGTESRVDKIRSRARARLAEIEDDFPSLSLKSSGASRGADDYDSLGGASKSLRISKRSVRSTIESD